MGIYQALEKLNPSASYEEVLSGEDAKPTDAVAPTEKPWDIRMTSVPADGKEPLLNMTTRHNYLMGMLPRWKEALRFRSYSLVLAGIGLFTITSIPVVGIAALFGASYYHMLGEYNKAILLSGRKVMWAQ